MKISAKAGNDFKPIPAGPRPAICVGVIDIGIQGGRGEYDDRPEIVLMFELPGERLDYIKKDGTRIQGPRLISRRFRTSMFRKANLRKFVEGLRGHFSNDEAAEDFDLKDLLGQRMLLNIVHGIGADGRTFASAGEAMPLMASTDPATIKGESPLLYYSLAEPDADVAAALPQWLRDAIANRKEPQKKADAVEVWHDEAFATGMKVPATDAELDDSDVPF